MVDFEFTNYARANGRDRLLQPDHSPSEMDDRRPLGLVYRGRQDRTIQLQSLGPRSERTRPNGWQASWTRNAIRLADHFDRPRPACTHAPRSAIVFRVELTDQNDSAISRHPLIPEPF